MGTPSVSTAAGSVKEKITRERILTSSEAAKDTAAMPDFWEYVESLTPEKWNDHIVYLYREDPKVSTYSGEFAYLDKFVGYIEVRPGVQIPMEERGIIEQAIKEKFGGRAFRLICKRGKERVTVGKCVNEAAPKYPDTSSQQFPGPLPNAPSDANAIASKAIDTVANHPSEAMNIALNALRASAEIIARSAAVPATPASSESDLDRALRQAMIAKLLAPAPDPMENYLRMRDLFTPPANSMMDKFLGVAMERMLNPAPALSGRTTLLDLGREALPVLAGTVRDAMTNWRVGVEAQRDMIALQRGVNPGPMMPSAAVPPQSLPAPAEEAASAAAPPASPQLPVDNNPPFEWLEMKIVEILKDKDFTVDQAVDETLAFLYRAHPAVVGLLLDPPKFDPRLAPGEQGVLQLFQNRPVLQQVPVNPRLIEFIKKFCAAAKESEAQRLGTAPPAAASAPPA